MKTLLKNIFSYHNSPSRRHKILTICGIHIKFRIKGVIEPYFKEYNKKIGLVDSEIIHIMANNIYTTTFYNMVKNYSEFEKHKFICYRGNKTKYLLQPNDENVCFGNIETLKIDLSKNKKIIIHGLLEEELFDWFYKHPEYLERTYWSIWSSDLYKFQGKNKYDYVRKNVKAIITIYDEEKYAEKYGAKKCFRAYYLNPLHDKFVEPMVKPHVNILVNQSVRGCTIDALKTLAKYKDEDIYVITPLSYYAIGEENVKNEIIQVGTELFGDHYIPLTRYLAPDIYARILSNIDIMVVNLENNGAMGNLAGVVYCGGKVFLKDTSTSNDAFKHGNIKTYSYDDIENLDFKDFIEYNEDVKNENINNIKKYFSEEYVASLWQRVFDEEVDDDESAI